MCPFPEHQRFRVIRMSRDQVIDIMTFNSYSLQYYSFYIGKIGFGFLKHEDWFLFLGQRQFISSVTVWQLTVCGKTLMNTDLFKVTRKSCKTGADTVSGSCFTLRGIAVSSSMSSTNGINIRTILSSII